MKKRQGENFPQKTWFFTIFWADDFFFVCLLFYYAKLGKNGWKSVRNHPKNQEEELKFPEKEKFWSWKSAKRDFFHPQKTPKKEPKISGKFFGAKALSKSPIWRKIATSGNTGPPKDLPTGMGVCVYALYSAQNTKFPVITIAKIILA